MTVGPRSLLIESSCLASEALRRLSPDDPSAIAEGRAFIDRRRIEDPGDLLGIGQRLTCYGTRRRITDAPNEGGLVIGRRDGIVAAAKPAAWASEPDRAGVAGSLREQLARTLEIENLHVATRLDVGVSGLVLVATDARSRQHLATVMASGSCHRCYVAIATGNLTDRGRWEGTVERHSKPGHRRLAVTDYERVAAITLGSNVQLGRANSGDWVSLLVLRPRTGHRHQLRIHSSRAGAPIVGDRRYGGATRFIDVRGSVERLTRIYLHAIETTLPLPNGNPWHVQCPISTDLIDLWLAIGGSAEDFAGLER